MKTHLQKLIGTAVLGLALVSTSIPAWAGGVSLPEVQVNEVYNEASGSMAGTRYSPDSQQYIGCIFDNPFVTCFAKDTTGKSLVCTSTDPRYATVIKALTDFSRIGFASAPGTGSCTALTVANFSTHLR
jgi:uncharacterized protein YjdB